MNAIGDPELEVSFTYLFPMREDEPAFADFVALRQEVVSVMGEDYPSPLITRINTMLAGNGIDGQREGVITHQAFQDTGQPGSVKAITFEAPLTVERVSDRGRRIGPVAAKALVEFAVRLHAYCESAQEWGDKIR